ncbi:MAG: hypothetical protein OEL54_05025 [Flavobacteriaceae bacterium]|nr:hypothetical protein [Flavobacteriaceae bacterium]
MSNIQVKQNDITALKVVELNDELLRDKIFKELNEASMCKGVALNKDVAMHAATKFALFLKTNEKWCNFFELDNFFMMLSQNDLGDIFGLAFTQLCKHFALYKALRRENKTNKNDVEHQQVKALESGNNQIIMHGGFLKQYNENNELALKCPYIYGTIVANLSQEKSESMNDFVDRCKKHYLKHKK